jgi:hypothetical protein
MLCTLTQGPLLPFPPLPLTCCPMGTKLASDNPSPAPPMAGAPKGTRLGSSVGPTGPLGPRGPFRKALSPYSRLRRMFSASFMKVPSSTKVNPRRRRCRRRSAPVWRLGSTKSSSAGPDGSSGAAAAAAASGRRWLTCVWVGMQVLRWGEMQSSRGRRGGGHEGWPQGGHGRVKGKSMNCTTPNEP